MARLSRRELAGEALVQEFAGSSDARVSPVDAIEMSAQKIGSAMERLSGDEQMREAVFLSFREPAPANIQSLLRLSSAEWRKLLCWLDLSGLSLYLLDRMERLGLCDLLPTWVVEDLRQKANDNKQRTAGMVRESVAIQTEFQRAGLRYAVMKGISLSPVSVPRPELRHQFDLDYLVAETSALAARTILESRGYHLYADSGRTWEMKIHETPNVSRRDLYKDLPYRSVELHLESDVPGQPSLLENVEQRQLCGMLMPVLSPIDLFLSQGMHAFKDVCSAYSRTAHLLEFYRHVVARHDAADFWRELRVATEGDRKTRFGIGIVLCLLERIMGTFAPEALTTWTSDVLPLSVRLWVTLYGRRAAFAMHPGTKLYLLLQRELEAAGVNGRRPVKTSLWPSRLPPPVIRGAAGETLAMRIKRYGVQTRFVLSRLQFHIVEGLRYAMESYRWRQLLDRLSS
jgi:hypothetical protein